MYILSERGVHEQARARFISDRRHAKKPRSLTESSSTEHLRMASAKPLPEEGVPSVKSAPEEGIYDAKSISEKRRIGRRDVISAPFPSSLPPPPQHHHDHPRRASPASSIIVSEDSGHNSKKLNLSTLLALVSDNRYASIVSVTRKRARTCLHSYT